MAVYGNNGNAAMSNVIPNVFDDQNYGNRQRGARSNQGPLAYDRPVPKRWINIGFVQTFMDSNGNEVEKFVSLPSNLPIDYMQEKELPGLRADASLERINFVKLLMGGNKLLGDLNKVFDTMTPGETIILPHVPGQMAIQLSLGLDRDSGQVDHDDQITTPDIMSFVQNSRNIHQKDAPEPVEEETLSGGLKPKSRK